MTSVVSGVGLRGFELSLTYREQTKTPWNEFHGELLKTIDYWSSLVTK